MVKKNLLRVLKTSIYTFIEANKPFAPFLFSFLVV